MNHGLVFPRILRIELRQFSLYSREPNIEIDVSDGVFCLVGANGLGKSTFLAAINFGITGVVRDPYREFKSVDEHFKFSRPYSDRFFDGRISEEDREAASIGMHIQVGDMLFKLRRGIFEPDELQELTILDQMDGKIIFDGTDETGSQRQKNYESRITKKIGLETFPQFVFLQHFVLTFDESRHLLFWDQRALNQALFLCMGANHQNAETADRLYREMEKAASLARNYSWRASQVASEIEMLRGVLGKPEQTVDLADLQGEHKALVQEVDELERTLNYTRNRYNDARLQWTESSAELSACQDQYSETFETFATNRSTARRHPLVVASLNEQKCGICDSEGEEVVDAIQDQLDQGRCPLCNSPLSEEKPDHSLMHRLVELDRNIADAKERLEVRRKAKQRLRTEVVECEELFITKLSELREFEARNELSLRRADSTTTEEISLKAKVDQLNTYRERKKKKYAERDNLKAQYLALQSQLEAAYTVARMKFVPTFRELAKLFLGVDVDVQMDFSRSISSLGASLTFEMRGSVRREQQQLSESQRFFLDIALRMALAQYVSSDGSEAALFIDTPEGSLDIAYESRVGLMFAKFIEMNHAIVMTANINSSQILRRLAQECGRTKMTLHRMTTWTELSEVQLAEEQLFSNALEEIENALDERN